MFVYVIINWCINKWLEKENVIQYVNIVHYYATTKHSWICCVGNCEELLCIHALLCLLPRRV